MQGADGVRIDHINIWTDRLEESCAFYQRLLGLTRSAPPGLDAAQYAWLRNDAEQPIVHIASPAETGRASGGTGSTRTGALHHVAFTCAGYDEWRGRIDAMGLACEVNDFPAASLRQLFVTDPDGVRLEFNFHGMPDDAFV